MSESIAIISKYAIPAIFLIILISGIYKEVNVYDAFVEGAKEGLNTLFKIIPALVGLLVAIGVFRASGALDIVVWLLNPIVELFGIPKEVLPLAILRPISGSASLALVSEIVTKYGPDSFIGNVASTMMGSTETIFYTLAVYFGSVGIKNIKYTLMAALIADVTSVIASVYICSVVFKM